jgi:hypothetical protein
LKQLRSAHFSELHNVAASRLRCARHSSRHRVESTRDVILTRLKKVAVSVENRHD